MNKLIINSFFVLGLLLFTTVGCEDKYTGVDYEKLEREEKELLERFYDNSAAWDSLKNLATNIIDKREESGLVYLERVKGTGDSVKVGDQVGIRYWYYGLALNDEDEPTLYFLQSNESSYSPHTFTVGGASEELDFAGIGEGIKYMCNLGRSTFVMPSQISTKTGFYTVVADIELVFVELE